MTTGPLMRAWTGQLGIFEASGAIRVDIRSNAEAEETPRMIQGFCPQRPRISRIELGRARPADAGAFTVTVPRDQSSEVWRWRAQAGGADHAEPPSERAGLELEREQPVAIELARHPQRAGCRGGKAEPAVIGGIAHQND